MKNGSRHNRGSSQYDNASIAGHVRYGFIFLAVALLTLLSFHTHVFPIGLTLHDAGPFTPEKTSLEHPDQLPHSRIAKGHLNILAAWFAVPTDRYRHGVLGDGLEASRLVVESMHGNRLQADLPLTRVFEDLEPRLVDLDVDNKDEVMVVESDTRLGASLSLYGIINDGLVRIAATPFLGKPNRWLNPLGVGDFDGDGQLEIALVATPHIGGILRLYRFKDNTLSLFAEYTGVSTHRIGSIELGLGRIISAKPRDRLLVPNHTRHEIMLLEWTPRGWQEIARARLPGNLASSLRPLGKNRWHFRLENGTYHEIQLTP